MKHNYSLAGFLYELRPVNEDDAGFIVDVRLADAERNQFIHPISQDVSAQENWIRDYYKRPGDYYFVISNRITGRPEGLISIYDVEDNRAEWGRWVINRGSMSALESVYLLYRIAFEQIGLDELFCRTVADNTSVVSLHDSIGEQERAVLQNFFELEDGYHDAVEHYADKAIFYGSIVPRLMRQVPRIFKRVFEEEVGEVDFDHVGVATKSIIHDLPVFSLLGYTPKGDVFTDKEQGVSGLFMTLEHAPTIELLENMPDSSTLDVPLQRGNKLYHLAFTVSDYDRAFDFLTNQRARVLSASKDSVYFGKRISFLLLPNLLMIELIEK